MKTQVERDLSVCENCAHHCESSGEPVTVGGWDGDVYYGWGRYAGVHMCRAIRYRCPDCRTEWSAEPDWDGAATQGGRTMTKYRDYLLDQCTFLGIEDLEGDGSRWTAELTDRQLADRIRRLRSRAVVHDCSHAETRRVRERCFSEPVYREPFTREWPAAHGAISYTELCIDCGSARAVNANGPHAEYGPWSDPAVS
jgi:hypothetical protein